MRLSGLLTRQQAEQIHADALRLLAEVGVQVEHEGLRGQLASVGGVESGDRVRFRSNAVESLVWSAPRHRKEIITPRVGLGCGIYHSWYLSPFSNQLIPFDERLFARYTGLARHLPMVEGVGVLGLPFVPEGISAECLPLAEKLYGWKYGASPCGSVQLTSLCEPMIEMFGIHADSTGRTLEDVFCACGWMISPLRLARPECEQLLFFASRGLRMYIGHMPSQGCSAPVTFHGTLILALAEQIFLFLLQRSLWEDAPFGLGGMVSTVDMRTGASLYGRPEKHRINMAFADLAEYYGCSSSGHSGCTDAHVPSCEAGVQKATGALLSALTTGEGYVEAGLLGVDEICSPVQMVLDHDIAGNLRTALSEVAFEDSLAEILEMEPGGNFLGSESTVSRFRSALFEPMTWTNHTVKAGIQSDVEKAVGIVADFEKSFEPVSYISETEERELRAVIRRVSGD